MNKNLPGKYSALMQAKEAGLHVPETLLVSEESKPEEIDAFLRTMSGDGFIIRSAVSAEDSANQSYAGYFWSSGKTTRGDAHKVIAEGLKKNEALVKEKDINADVYVMIQPYISGNSGGILFSRWKYYEQYFFGEMSAESAHAAVEGRSSDFFLLSKEKSGNSPLPLLKDWSHLERALRAIARKIDTAFPYPADIEWVGDESGEITIVQVRPITRTVNALFPYKGANFLPKGEWRRTALSESLSILSPLTFSLISSLFKGALPSFQRVGYRAKKLDFLRRLPNGEVVSEARLEQSFYKDAGFWSPFLRSFHKRKFLKEAQEYCRRPHFKRPFSYARLQKLFSLWMIANAYLSPGKHLSYTNREYELSVYSAVRAPRTGLHDWKAVHFFLREWFFFELNKLKEDVQKNPLSFFMTLAEVQKGGVSKTELQNREAESVYESMYDYSRLLSVSNDAQVSTRVAGKGRTRGEVFLIENPNMFSGRLPKNTIIVAPFFRNEWISDMSEVAGILLEGGGFLSHSAIVAREKNIPYFIRVQGATARFKSGQYIILDANASDILLAEDA